MSDLIARLRTTGKYIHLGGGAEWMARNGLLMQEAADEIERLTHNTTEENKDG